MDHIQFHSFLSWNDKTLLWADLILLKWRDNFRSLRGLFFFPSMLKCWSISPLGVSFKTNIQQDACLKNTAVLTCFSLALQPFLFSQRRGNPGDRLCFGFFMALNSDSVTIASKACLRLLLLFFFCNCKVDILDRWRNHRMIFMDFPSSANLQFWCLIIHLLGCTLWNVRLPSKLTMTDNGKVISSLVVWEQSSQATQSILVLFTNRRTQRLLDVALWRG